MPHGLRAPMFQTWPQNGSHVSGTSVAHTLSKASRIWSSLHVIPTSQRLQAKANQWFIVPIPSACPCPANCEIFQDCNMTAHTKTHTETMLGAATSHPSRTIEEEEEEEDVGTWGYPLPATASPHKSSVTKSGINAKHRPSNLDIADAIAKSLETSLHSSVRDMRHHR